jgi:Fic family protein
MFSFFRRILPRAASQAATKINLPASQMTLSPIRPLSVSSFYQYEPARELQASLLKATELKAEIEAAQKNMNADLRLAVHTKLRALWTYHSNAIEGSTLTLGDTIFFLKEGLTVGGKPIKDFLDARNHAEAIDYLYDYVANGRELTPYLMKEINALLLTGIKEIPAIDPLGRATMRPISPGDYKKQPNYVVQQDSKIYQYVEPMQVAPEMEKLFEWIKANMDRQHPIITSTVAHYNAVRIHPFDDGNGRGARILMNLILMNKRYQPAVIRKEDRKAYIEALNQADKGNITPFTMLVAQSLIETQNLIIAEIRANRCPSNESTPGLRK